QGHVDRISESFEIYSDAIISKDFKTAVSKSHPAIVELGGGEVYVIDDLQRDHDMYAAIGVHTIKMEAKQPSKVIEAGNELHAMLPVEHYMKTPVDTTQTTQYYLAVSRDEGSSWYFVDMKRHDESSIKVFLPNYDDRLNVYLRQ
ncbi:MAG: hypothetical protein AAFQ02_09790, partial [Bacteroidota bacterium]